VSILFSLIEQHLQLRSSNCVYRITNKKVGFCKVASGEVVVDQKSLGGVRDFIEKDST